jgi:CBS domain-containing protein
MEELLEQAMQQSFIPVVDDRGAFIGIVTRQTIMRKLALPNLEVIEPNTQLA